MLKGKPGQGLSQDSPTVMAGPSQEKTEVVEWEAEGLTQDRPGFAGHRSQPVGQEPAIKHLLTVPPHYHNISSTH